VNPSDVVVWFWLMPAMPEIGINDTRVQSHLAQVLSAGRHSSTIELVKLGKSITVKNRVLFLPSAKELKTYHELKTQLELEAKQKLGDA
jgi:hypothetical protein